MATEVQPKLTIQEKAEILREQGVDAFGWLEPEIVRPNITMPLFPTIWFRGDENDGQRAVRIMQERGVRVYELQRQWHYEGDENPRIVRWAMLF